MPTGTYSFFPALSGVEYAPPASALGGSTLRVAGFGFVSDRTCVVPRVAWCVCLWEGADEDFVWCMCVHVMLLMCSPLAQVRVPLPCEPHDLGRFHSHRTIWVWQRAVHRSECSTCWLPCHYPGGTRSGRNVDCGSNCGRRSKGVCHPGCGGVRATYAGPNKWQPVCDCVCGGADSGCVVRWQRCAGVYMCVCGGGVLVDSFVFVSLLAGTAACFRGATCP